MLRANISQNSGALEDAAQRSGGARLAGIRRTACNRKKLL